MAAGESFGDAMRRIRRARELSLRALSRMALVDVGYLSKVENGRRQATPAVAKAVDRALQAKGELIAFAAVERAERVRRALPFDPMRRRSLLALGVGASALAAAPSEGVRRRGKVGIADANELQDTAVWLYGLDYQHGGGALWRAAAASAREGYDMLEHGCYSETVERRLLRATGRIQMCAGWLAFDAGRHEVARSCYTEALALARQAGDGEVEAHAFSNLAFQSNVLGQPREAMRFVEGAARAASTANGTARISAVPLLRRSIALALGEDRRGHEKAISEARKIVDRDHDKPVEEWCSFLGTAELDGVEGTCLLELKQPRRAERLFDRAIAGYSGRFARNRALYRVRLACARLDSRTIDGAAEAATAALDDLDNRVASWRVENELAAVAARLAQYRAEESVQIFLTRYSEARHRTDRNL